ncbi:MAG: homoserine dehydrogenase [Alphaproteobacteria bacterium]|nr:homoserine dehydrogenase [Alphaproteobacteria bacterium]MBV9695201.1 homoserine dehydrogenase [Alphaproteobacteria bacterium]
MNTAPLRIAVAGLGTVGGGVLKALQTRGGELAERAGRRLDVVAVSAREREKPRAADISGIAWVDDPSALASADADVVVELMGGEDGAALALIEAALSSNKHVVTANKALLARHGARLAALAERSGLALKFEAAAAGGIPIVKALRESLIAHGINSVCGILNGTCNFILTEMEKTGRGFADVLKDAQALGYAEADPALDIGGGDTAHKLALLSSLAFGTVPDLEHMHVEGIAAIMPEDIRYAREFGFRIKLLGVARRVGAGIEQRVRPAMVRAGTPLGEASGAFNAVAVDAGEAGPFFFEGRGAGAGPTASAVIADLVDIALGSFEPAFGKPAHTLTPLVPAPATDASSAFYLRFNVLDIPGVVAEIAGHLADAGVSIESMLQRGRNPGEAVSIVMITHDTPQASVTRALKAIARSDKVLGSPGVIPMELG